MYANGAPISELFVLVSWRFRLFGLPLGESPNRLLWIDSPELGELFKNASLSNAFSHAAVLAGSSSRSRSSRDDLRRSSIKTIRIISIRHQASSFSQQILDFIVFFKVFPVCLRVIPSHYHGSLGPNTRSTILLFRPGVCRLTKLFGLLVN